MECFHHSGIPRTLFLDECSQLLLKNRRKTAHGNESRQNGALVAKALDSTNTFGVLNEALAGGRPKRNAQAIMSGLYLLAEIVPLLSFSNCLAARPLATFNPK